MASVELHMRINDAYMPVLSIPVTDCNRFSLKPLSWLRFLGYCIYGRIGHISSIPDGPTIDYEMAVQAGAQYYFTSPETPRLLDIRCIDDRTSDAETTESQHDFRGKLKDRDGTCIVTNAPAQLCEGAHYCPHSKGSEYLTRLIENRGSKYNIDDINDIRNGLLLSLAVHKVFGLGHMAFLRTPNFALVERDVPPSPGPIRGPQSASLGRFTLQHFRQLDEYTIRNSPHNQDARLPANMNQFPPPIIVDMFYGCAAVLQWGLPQSSAAIWSSVESSYYDNTGSGGESSSERDNADGEGDTDGGDETDAQEATPTSRDIRARKWANRKCAQAGSQLNTIDEAMDLVIFLWSQPGPGHREESPPTQEDFRRERVDAWLRAQ